MEHSPPLAASSVDEVADALAAELPAGADLVVPIANGEPVHLLDALEARADRLDGVRIHQMHALRDRPYLHGTHAGHLEHVSWFLSHVTRPAYHEGGCHFAPANFSEVPLFLMLKRPFAVLAAASAMDRHGYFSLGVCADYAAAMIGRVPFVLEVNPNMPATHGANRVHHSEVLRWCEAETDLVEMPAAEIGPDDHAIAELIADRIPHGATIQLGIGSIPSAVAGLLTDHRDLGVHTELLSDPIAELAQMGVITGTRKKTHRRRIVTTFALGSRDLYDWCDGNDAVQFLPVDEVNDPRLIGREPNFISVNATLEVDLFGQCASESLGSHYWSGSGGQADFARGAQYSDGGDGFVVLSATAKKGAISRIVPTLTPGAVVTTQKNTVDNVVTEHGVAELQGRTLRERARNLIAVADPSHRDSLERSAAEMGLLH
jgi:acyl-CoA hydrolase